MVKSKTPPQEPESKVSETPLARVILIVGRSNESHGMRFVEGQRQIIADPVLIEKLKADGNFSVEMVR